MRLTLPRLFSRQARLLAATTVVLTLAVSHLVAQFASLDTAFEGELWGVRHELAMPNGGLPSGVAYVNGTVFVADPTNATVIAYDSAGVEIAMAGADWAETADELSPAYGLVPNQLFAATVTVDGQPIAAVLVSDSNSHRVLAFDTTGAHLFTLQLDRPQQSSAAGYVAGIAMAPGSQFVLATGAVPSLQIMGSLAAGWTNEFETDGVVLAYKNVASVAYNGGQGRFEATPTSVLTGQEGNNLTPAPQLPFGVVFDADGNLYTIDTNTERLSVYDGDFGYQFTFGTPAPDGTVEDFNQPHGLAFSGDRLIVADSGNHRLVVYRPDLLNAGLDELFTIEGLGDGVPGSVAVDAVSGRLAVSDSDGAAARVWVLETPNLATFDIRVLDDLGAPTESVCLGSDYRVQFSVTVPAGRPAVSDVVPSLSINGAAVTSTFTTGGAYPNSPMQAGQVATYTYALTMAANAAIGDFVIEAGATASTTDVLFRQGILSVADCATAAPTITASENHPRQVSGWTPVPSGDPLVLTLTATDDEGVSMIEYQISGQNDPGIAIAPETYAGDQATEELSIPLPEYGPTKVKFRARDNHNRKSAWQELDFRIRDVAAVQSNEGETVAFTIGSSIGTGYTFSATGLPQGVGINAATGQIGGFLDFDSSGPYTVEVTETLGLVSTSVSFTWTVLQINRPPVIDQPTAAAAVDENQFSLQVTGYDPDGDQAFFTMYGRSVPLGYDVPPTVSINPATGLISGTFGAASEAEYVITVGLSECSSPADSPVCTATVPGERLATLVAFTVSVSRANMPPLVNSPGTLTHAEGTVVSLPIAASDPDDDAIAYFADNLPLGLTIDETTGVISGTIGHDALRSYAVTLEVNDGVVGHTSSVSFTWNVTDVNRPPTVSVPDQLSIEGETISGVTVGRNDGEGDPLTFAMTGLPPGTLTIDANTGIITGAFDYSSAGIYQVTVTADDGSQTGSIEFEWTVEDVNRHPVLAPVDQFSVEGDTVAVAVAGSDPDGDHLTYSMNGLPAAFSIDPDTGVISGTFDFDSAGEFSVNVGVNDGALAVLKTFTWTVAEVNRAPIVVAAADQVNTEGDTVTGVAISASDPDGRALTYSATGLPAGLTIDAGTGVITGAVALGSAGTYAVTVSVGDGDETATTTFAWTVHANRPPAVLVLPDRTDAEGTTVTIAVSATDPDLSAVLAYSATGLPSGIVIDPASGQISGTLDLSSSGVHTVRVTVSDGLTTVATTFTWTVTEQNQPPTVASADRISNEGETISVPISASDPDGNQLTFTMSGLPATHVIDSATGVITGTFSYESAGPYTVTVSVSDGFETAATTFTWTVLSINRYPVLVVADQFSDEGDTVALPIDGSDPDGGTLVYSMNGLPAGFSIAADTGVISGTFSYDSEGTYSVNVGLTDGTDAVLKTFTWTVLATNRAPVVDALPNRTDAENDTVTISVTATDPDGQPLTYSALNLPPGMTINATTGVISGTLSYTAAGTHAVQVLVSDGIATTTRTFTWTVTNVNRPPTASAANRTNPEGTTVSFGVTSNEPDGEALTFTATGLPAGISLNPTTGIISGTLGYTTAGIYNVVVKVTDPGGLFALAPFTWTVTNANAPPVVTPQGARTNYEGDVINLTFPATDDDGQALTFSVSGLPAGLVFDAMTGTLTGTLGYTTSGNYSVTVTATDGQATASMTFSWTVINVNRPPVVTNPGPQSNGKGTAVTLPIAASDPDIQALTYTATGLPPGLTINTTTGVIAGTIANTANPSYNVTVRASDGSLFDEETFAWTVVTTNRPPTIVNPGNQTSAQGTAVTLPISASDLDGDTLTFSIIGLPANLGINPLTGVISGTLGFTGAQTYTVTVTVRDPSGASASTTFTWTVVAAPVCVAGTFTLNGNSSTSGTAGNIRTYTANGVNVKVSAFARAKSNGAWSTAFLGAWSAGVGVTDGSEGDGSGDNHMVDNIGDRNNFVLFEFDRTVVVTKAYLDYVGADSDAMVWVGTRSNPYANHLTLSDSLLASLGSGEENAAGSGDTRWATFNGGQVSGNVLIISALPTGTNDSFKVGKLQFASCPETPTCSAATVATTGDSALDGTDGNVRSFSANGVNIKASAFSRAKSNGSWSSAFLGAFSPGIGVTDGSEGNGSGDAHKVDNVGDRNNYVLFEFDRPVVVTKVYLTYIGADSDMTVWVGTKNDPYNNHLTLSDSLLAGLRTETITGSTTAAHWKAFNGDEVSGNVIIIAANTGGSDDAFKIGKLEFTTCAPAPVNHAPTVTGSNRSSTEGDSVSVQITGTDADGDALTYTASGLPTGLSINQSTGAITGNLGYTSSGTYNVTITVTDDGALSGTAAFTWTVANKNRTPDAASDAASTKKNKAVTISVLANDTDPDGNPLTVSSVSSCGNGTIVKNSNGTVTFTPKSNFTGTTTFTYDISDGAGGTDSATVTVTVTK